ncbi:hypothetical protein PTRA_b0443 [Pseudoalteromonas translucida KMM 520]|uniref:Oxidoreductase-like domain-containing protein n=1 Tax=Pseudoalteromonas translucida KMM 520 TaxID=1315283 RepID=A0A0U2VBA5_9GAMM|nr:oxidoreductase-like domain-containing protein [Pseudoalteromonas translucida]ALS34924.1 hypothetical protein PTRA_b0443 [Pseudoalteromonas translucida KMM 520]
MQLNGLPAVAKPEKPKPDECCGGGSCCPCVWDEYKEQLAIWKRKNEQHAITIK